MQEITAAGIRAYREKLRLSQENLASHLGVTRNTIARWERGELMPQSPKMLSLALQSLARQLAVKQATLKAIQTRVLNRQRRTSQAVQELLEKVQAG